MTTLLEPLQPVAVLGSGGWGTALAVHLGRLGKPVWLWGRNQSLVTKMVANRENRLYLPGVELPELVRPTYLIEKALDGARCVVCAVPSHGTRDVLRSVASIIDEDAVIVSATKGLEVGTLLRMTQVIEEEVGSSHEVAVLSGPSFSKEVVAELPTAVCVAGRSELTVQAVQQEFRSHSFRLYGTDDVVGVEIGGAMKNVIAIAAGVVESLELGQNALSALITRGLAEISRLAEAAGGRRETLSGLSGLGDLVLTCTGALSRNRSLGLELGRGHQLNEVLDGMKTVAEGVRTTGAAIELGKRYGVELPITAQMADVLAGLRPPRAAVEELMLRRQRSEC